MCIHLMQRKVLVQKNMLLCWRPIVVRPLSRHGETGVSSWWNVRPIVVRREWGKVKRAFILRLQKY